MSSVQKKSNGAFKNLLLLRRASIDKIKCTAYPILGSIFEKKFSLIHNDDLINLSSRTNGAVQFFFIMMTTTFNLIRKHSGGVSFETLQKFIDSFNNQLKSKPHLYSEERVERLNKNKETDSDAKCTSDVIRREEKDQIDSSQGDKKFYELARTLKESTKKSASDEDVKSVGLLKLSYGLCLAVVYVQLTMLLLMIGFCAFKLGFFFLLACVATIAYFMLKISFLKKKDGAKIRRSNRKSRLPNHESKAIITSCKPVAFVFPQIRLKMTEKISSAKTQNKQKKL